jgi:hypothetical protein
VGLGRRRLPEKSVGEGDARSLAGVGEQRPSDLQQGAVARRRVEREHPQEDLLDRDREVGADLARRLEEAARDVVEDLQGVVAVVRAPRVCSGDMYAAVPSTMSVPVSAPPCVSPISFEMPKSSTLGKRSPQGPRERKMFAGFRSRCTTPSA